MFSKGSKSRSSSSSSGTSSPGGGAVSESTSTGTPSIISSDLKIVGHLSSKGDVQVDGIVEGDIDSRRLTVGEAATVKGAITADSVSVYGKVQGEIHAQSVALAPTAQVEGDIAHRTLAMEAGASVTGRLSRIESGKEAAKASATSGTNPVSDSSRAGSDSNGGSGGVPGRV